MVSRRWPHATALVALISLTAAVAQPAAGFSRFENSNGAAPPARDGILSVPLPPLPGQESDSVDEAPDAGGAKSPDERSQSGNAPATTGQGAPAAPAPGSPATGTTPTGQAAPATDATPSTAQPLAPAPSGSNGAGTPAVPAAGAPAGAEESATPPTGAETPDVPDDSTTDEGEDGSPNEEDAAAAAAPVDIRYADDGLPEAVKTLRAKLIEIAKSGDIEKLRPFIEPGQDGTVLSFGDSVEDPITFLKSASGDGEGVEILAILLEILQAGHVQNDPGSDEEIFVWPYFTRVAMTKLTKPQMVELFELVTAGDYEEMKTFGAYNFYRVGISPDGKLQFFVAGD
ncbi:hypothetical protein [Mangrovicella endophytica]|uniref:hypothetical protein n=1 Tax=Mangrovicella endophytica TaxID=2066697 RepID=UPI000C9DBD44|nr:hypothetical protein [Mangrovicella endophytica]